MFERITDLNFAKTFIDIEVNNVKLNKEDLKEDLKKILTKIEPSIICVEEEDSEAEFLVDCVYYPAESDEDSDFTSIDATLMAYDILNEIEKDNFSFESLEIFTIPLFIRISIMFFSSISLNFFPIFAICSVT